MEDGTLPEGILVHPALPGSKYPNKDLCGAGVAFKLAWGVAQKVSNSNKLPSQYRSLFTELTALVAMGTIADIMPLTNENRQLVAFGLKQMRKTDFVGVRALVEASVKDPEAPLKAGQVSYHVAPRINAAGRLGSGQKAFDLLTSDLNFESLELTAALGKDNDLRKEIEADIVDKAFAQVIDIYGEKPLMAGLVAVDENWHEGVVGIVASRVVERFHRPSIVLSILEDGVNVKGSGRSALKVDMKDALDECEDLLDKYGGHGAAVGLSMKREHLDEFRERFAMACAKQLGYDTPELTDVFEELKIDSDLPIKDVTFNFMKELSRLEPCGMGNKKPIFSSTVKLAGEPTLMGKLKSHMSFNIEQGGKVLRCIMWKRADLYPDLMKFSGLPIAKTFRIAFRPDINEFRGRKHIQLIVSEILMPKEEE
jgi:single-stranded-DNA-specific exonuclease